MTTRITKSTGNVYADLGIKNPEEHALKAELVRQIATTMKELQLTQTAAAARLGVEQPDVSKMLKGQFRPISLERLMYCLVALGQSVTIAVGPPAKRSSPEIRVTSV